MIAVEPRKTAALGSSAGTGKLHDSESRGALVGEIKPENSPSQFEHTCIHEGTPHRTVLSKPTVEGGTLFFIACFGTLVRVTVHLVAKEALSGRFV